MIKPKTRKEVFMDAIAKGKKPAIEPLTREEVLMAEHAEREASGGGGASSLTLIITGSYDAENDEYVFTANKTFEECAEAVQNNSLSVIYRTTQKGDYNTIRDIIYSPMYMYHLKGDNGDGTFTALAFIFMFDDVEIGNSSFSKLDWYMDAGFTCNA